MSALLNLVPLPYRLLGLVILAVALMSFGWVKGAESAKAKFDQLELQRAHDELVAVNKAGAETKRLQAKKDGALHAANQREIDLRQTVSDLDAVAGSLQHDLDASRAALAGASCTSVRNRAAALEDVFGQCVDRYKRVAEKADRHASDALMFEQAWPK